ncbi:hypothetical protein [Streptomyces sp. NPDC088350]|uniref:hypothetical protein n=1 Tax=Streptomyces sp. NPDC088350 TaxID=3365854 RepID=UPI0037F6AD3B
MLGTDHRLAADEAGQRLVPVPWKQQPGQILAKPTPLRRGLEEIIEAGGVGFQRTERGRAWQPLRHLGLHEGELELLLPIYYRPDPPSTNHR